MNYSYQNYTALYGRCHVSATIRNSDSNIEKAMKENNTTHDSDNAAIEILTLMNWA